MSCFPKTLQPAVNRFFVLLYTALALYLTFLLLRFPALSLEYAKTGLMLWFTKMVPVLLPFMILSGIMIRMNLTERFVGLIHPLLHGLYGVSKNGSYVILMGFLCGFPMGARIIGELLETDKLSGRESALLLYFCNNIGPIYFLSYVIPTLGLKKTLVPFCIMYGVPLLYGLILFRMPHLTKGDKKAYGFLALSHSQDKAVTMPLLSAVDSSVSSGLFGIAKLGGYMVFFNLLNICFVPFSDLPPFLPKLYNCILEITSGIDRVGQSMPYLVLIMLPFGGFSCIAQTYSMICHTNLSIRPYLLHKLAQTGLTALIYLLWHPF